MSLMDVRVFVLKSLKASGISEKACNDIEKSISLYTKKRANEYKFKVIWSDKNIRRFYTRKARSILFNKEAIKKHIDDGTLRADDVAFTSCYDLRPDLYTDMFERRRNKELLTRIVDAKEKYDGILKCDACSSMKTRYVELQTRSADEPLTVFANCLACDHRWTIK